MIRIVDFSKSYSIKTKVPQVRDISFEVQKGSVTALLGANGSGKSTLLKSIYGLHYPSKGQILVSDKNGTFYDASENPDIIKNLVGYVPEISVLPKKLTVKEILYYAASLHGLSFKDVERVVEKCSLGEVYDKKVHALSKGYGQRLSFAQAIIHKPCNLILDEPVTGLDPNQIVQMRKMILDYSKENSVLMSTHMLSEVSQLCNKIYILSNGQLVAGGNQEEICRQSGTKDLESAFLKVCS